MEQIDVVKRLTKKYSNHMTFVEDTESKLSHLY